ncbi:MAG: hypothetical protein KC493_14930 [Bacteriovoracaceae bacterium]|nr:hypothetical protein [Bacteriovoracaceae bacterium]
MAFRLFFLYYLLSSISVYASGRPEVDRFTLLHDRHTIDRYIRSDTENYIFYLDAAISSGVKTIIGDIKDSAQTEQNPAQRQIKTLQVLTRNLNTEKYLDIDLRVGVPLPIFKIKQFEFKLSPFYNINLGTSFSFNNQNTNSTAQAQTYVRKEIKMGVKSKIKKRKDETIIINFYQLTRADINSSLDQSEIVTQGELVEFSSIDQNNISYATDLGYERDFSHYLYRFEVNELKLMETSASMRKTTYTELPMFHFHYRFKNKEFGLFTLDPLYGVHFRDGHTLAQGLYVGVLAHLTTLPFTLYTKMSNQFLTFNPLFRTSYFQLNYGLKVPYRNPQNDLWTASIHSLNIAVPLP